MLPPGTPAIWLGWQQRAHIGNKLQMSRMQHESVSQHAKVGSPPVSPTGVPPGHGLANLNYEEGRQLVSPDGGLQQQRSPSTSRQAPSGGRARARQRRVIGDTHDVSNQDVILEQLAHSGAYGELDPRKLAAWGYREAGAANDPESGFRAVLYMPTAEALEGSTEQAQVIRAIHGGQPPPVLAFRGTAEDRGIRDDMSKDSVGSYQFASNEGRIADILTFARGRVIVSGHSLGGALAQLTATHFPSQVSRVVTFQAPAIAKAETDRLKTYNRNAKPEDRVRSTHHRASGDVVHLAGERLTEGDVFTHVSKGIGSVRDHGAHPLARLSAARGDAIPGINDDLGWKGGDRLTRVNKTTTEHEKSGIGPWLMEQSRKLGGGLLRDPRMTAYVEVWNQVSEMIEAKVFGKGQILAIIDINPKLTADQRVKMRDQVERIMGDSTPGKERIAAPTER